ncbi:MAG: pyridoxal phosphate-dependent aminotransferase [Desulfobacterales bacterium]|nr:pyridoxal phosphate-dependent aminotransferase [Desulfobacterales bacterium]
MPIAERMIRRVADFAVIKNMFEEGRRLKERFGAENVYDFSLGNPDVPPPEEFRAALRELVRSDTLSFGYAPVAGHLPLRQALARRLSTEHGTPVPPEMVVVTVGAAGALNDILRALVNPGEEILTPAPYFLGYDNYAFLTDAVLKTAPTDARFHLDLAAIERAITPQTRVVLINSPNNPSGAVYAAAEINGLGRLLAAASDRLGGRIYLVCDEPYRRIVFDAEVAPVMAAYPHTVVVNSFSKELSLAGERIGYFAVHPQAEDAETIRDAAAAVNSMLVVNAPGLLQQAVARVLGAAVDVSAYRRRRDLMGAILNEAGYEFTLPEGAFYLFPKSPVPDDARFADMLKEERILVSPGRAFGVPGYFRISFAVPDVVIRGAREGLIRAMRRAAGA